MAGERPVMKVAVKNGGAKISMKCVEGGGCEQHANAMAAALGAVTHDERTEDFYRVPEQTVKAEAQA